MIETKHKDIDIQFVDWEEEEGWRFDNDPSNRVFPKLSSCKDAIDKMLSVKYYEQQVFQFKNTHWARGSAHYTPHDNDIKALIATRPHRNGDREFFVKARNPKNPKANRPELSRGTIYLDNDHNRSVLPKLFDAHARLMEAEAAMIEIFKSLEVLERMEEIKK